MTLEAVRLPGRLVSSSVGRSRLRSCQRAAAETPLTLGKRMAVLGVGDREQLGRIAVLDEQLRAVAKTQAPTAALLHEREELLSQLARKAMLQPAPPPGAETEYYQAIESQRALDTASVPALDRVGHGPWKLGVAVLVGVCLLGLLVFIAWPRSGSDRNNVPDKSAGNSSPSPVALAPPKPAPAVGTVTFAEYVDLQAGIVRREGRRFSTGRVYLIIRSPRPFGDTRLVVSYLPSGALGWQTLGEYSVDPNNDLKVVIITLLDPGRYNVRVQTSRGERIAEDFVEVTGF